MGKKCPARGAEAQRASAYCCFLPDLAGLGGARSHGSWRGEYILQYSGKNGKAVLTYLHFLMYDKEKIYLEDFYEECIAFTFNVGYRRRGVWFYRLHTQGG